ncbi:MAG: hypothetical protein PHO32_02280 [Candidatus Cloacimonetes bacterium]|nr:hypothetical protein [Candidatus Cloacimonadota bacterium]
MNRDFFRPLLWLVLAVLLLGGLAMLIPAWSNNLINIKKLSWFDSLSPKAEIATPDTISAVEAIGISSDLIALKPFLKKLNNPNSTLRIAYFGDSIIEGDLITAKLRGQLQASHGGSGVGLVPITSIVSGFRQTIKHTFAKNWESLSFMSPHNQDVSLGFTGFTFIPRSYYVAEKAIEPLKIDSLAIMDSSFVAPKEVPKKTRYYVSNNPWVEYSGSSVAGGSASFSQIRLFYSHASDSSYVYVSKDGLAKQKYSLRGAEGLQTLNLSSPTPISKIRLEFSAHDPIHVYGLSFDEPKGAYVDNFPIRGYSGMYFQRIHSEILKGFNNSLGYDLIVLQYGENVSNPAIKDYSHYARGMKKTIQHIQAALPGVPILLISAHDRSVKINGEYTTSPDIPYLVKAQSQIASETGTGFWNLFAAMGGAGSMPTFVNHKPAWSGKDFTHFTRSGGEHIAMLLLDYLQGNQP